MALRISEDKLHEPYLQGGYPEKLWGRFAATSRQSCWLIASRVYRRGLM